MNKKAQDLKAKRGMDFLVWLEGVLALFRKEGNLKISGNVRVHETRTGKHIVAEAEDVSFRGAFAVSLVGENEIQVGAGIVEVNGLLRVPTIEDQFIDGLDEAGDPYPEGAPTLALDPPGDDPRSLLYVRVGGSQESGAGNQGDEPVVEIVQSIPERSENDEGDAADDSGTKAIAVLLWKAGKVTGVRQITYFDQVAELRDGGAGGGGERWVILADS